MFDTYFKTQRIVVAMAVIFEKNKMFENYSLAITIFGIG
jgi:hypothetical protein